jgi:flagellar basal-body rod modification protein FlgD
MSAITAQTSIQNLDHTAPSSSAAQGSSALGAGEFMKLLMAQLSNQDPLQPQDSSAFVAQLAQFTSVQLLQSADSNLGSLLLAQASANQIGDASLVGKDVLFKSGDLSLVAGKAAPVEAHLAGAATQVTVTITDANGKVVRTLPLGAQSAGDVTASWDGLDASGVQLPPGTYHAAIAAADATGKAVSVTEQARGRVTGISFESGYPELLIGGARVKLADVVEINQPA